jgi:DNA-binding PadR family transcriptional regulator
MEWTDGMLYPVLHRLERLGYIKARWEEAESGRRRKYYRITSQGKTQLAEEQKQWRAVDATLRGIWRRKPEIPSIKFETSTNHKMFKALNKLRSVFNFGYSGLRICFEFRA